MARSFHRKRSLQPQSELNVTALIDLGFALLIIFMISTPLIEKEQMMEVNLPVASPSQTSPTEPDTVSVVVVSGGYQVNNVAMSETELEQQLSNYAAMMNPPVLSIRADAEMPYQRVVRLLDLLEKHQLSKIQFVTRPDEG